MDTEIFKNPIVLGICGGIVSLVFVYLDAKANNKETNTISYIKVFGLVALLIGAVAYFMTDKNLQIIGGGSKLFEQINSVAGGGSGNSVDKLDIDTSDMVGGEVTTNIGEFRRRVLTTTPDW